MSDMLVKLYALDENDDYIRDLQAKGIIIKKAFIADRDRILDFIRKGLPDHDGWIHECEYALFNNPVSCYIAVKNKEVIGLACYDATTKGFFGPTGVREDQRKQGVGKALLKKSLFSMKESGYAYAIIGWAAESAIKFYQETVNAVIIDDSPPQKSIYRNMLAVE
jgi:GNAT superfamily N-acetyltransferase